ncbi:hypothetical protein E2C01_097306 [Portunus trituberculatus]|uniref:Uncharacterized protein n=1 Tax=Portunus trituberculatus TaxID=210409 RepID=A0A5B7K031_PORTR|nr:hypothetical protein [Portunus trituberculatus]
MKDAKGATSGGLAASRRRLESPAGHVVTPSRLYVSCSTRRPTTRSVRCLPSRVLSAAAPDYATHIPAPLSPVDPLVPWDPEPTADFLLSGCGGDDPVTFRS